MTKAFREFPQSLQADPLTLASKGPIKPDALPVELICILNAQFRKEKISKKVGVPFIADSIYLSRSSRSNGYAKTFEVVS